MKYLIANWKMNLTEKPTLKLAKQYKKLVGNVINHVRTLEVVVAPSFLYLEDVKEELGKSGIKLAAQDVAGQDKGSYTGEVSAAQLKEVGCEYVIIGHSERRSAVNEMDALINKKINQTLNAGLTPILCLGETADLKEQRQSVLIKQLQTALQKVSALPEKDILICYEPVWAIGSGKPISAHELQPVQMIIKRAVSSLYSEKFFEEHVSLLYGGSVNSANAKDFWNLEFLSGMLVATASLEAGEFADIAKQA